MVGVESHVSPLPMLGAAGNRASSGVTSRQAGQDLPTALNYSCISRCLFKKREWR